VGLNATVPDAPAADERVPAFWRALGLPGLIDVHVHFLPPRMLRRVWAYFDNVGPLTGVRWPIAYRWPDEDRVAHLAIMGVRRYSALAYAHRPDMASDLNDWTLDFAAANPACAPSATFFPEPTAPSYVDKALARGARIFKLHIQVGDFDPGDPLLDPVWARLAEARVPIVVHAGSGPAPGRYTGPDRFGRVLARHPALRAVIAHLGGPEYREFLELAERYDDVVLDTTMAFTTFLGTPGDYPRDLLPRLRELGLAGKVVLGSDFPNIPYPYVEQLDGLAGTGLGDDWLRAVCWHNGAALIGVPDQR
jgi:predicted TIM-barrel fold metal-dependent hydrolase